LAQDAKAADPKKTDTKKPAAVKLTPKEQAAADEAVYNKLSDPEKSKRCTALRNQVECNKIRHCCYWEYEDPKYEEYLPICLDFNILNYYYVRNDKAYIEKLNQSSRSSQVNEGNLCGLLKFDSRFPKVRRCSCEYMAQNNGSGLMGVAGLAVVGIAAMLMEL
jgi:hypothetical protein